MDTVTAPPETAPASAAVRTLDNIDEGDSNLIIQNFKDRRWRLNNLYKVVDKFGDTITFKFNWMQEEIYNSLWYMNLVLKSRQPGSTTFWCINELDAALFNKNYEVGIIAQSLPDAESIFRTKIKFPYENLPDFIKNNVTAKFDTKRELALSNGSVIRVGTSLRSSTLNVLHVSEFGKICAKNPEKAREVVTGALNTIQPGQFVVIESTAEGREGYFHDFCRDAQAVQKSGKKLTKLDFKFFFFAWWKDPSNRLDPTDVTIFPSLRNYFDEIKVKHNIILDNWQKAWYSKKLAMMKEDMKREYPSTTNEAFEAIIQGSYYATQLNRIRELKRLTKVPYEDGLPVDTTWDLGVNDTNSIWWIQNFGGQHNIIDCYESSGEGLKHYIDVLKEKYDKLGYRYGHHVAPFDIMVRDYSTGQTRWKTAKEFGITFDICRKHEIVDGIETTRQFLANCWFDELLCGEQFNKLEKYQKEWDVIRGTFKKTPLHNEASNCSDSLRNYAYWYNTRMRKPAKNFKSDAAKSNPGGWT